VLLIPVRGRYLPFGARSLTLQVVESKCTEYVTVDGIRRTWVLEIPHPGDRRLLAAGCNMYSTMHKSQSHAVEGFVVTMLGIAPTGDLFPEPLQPVPIFRTSHMFFVVGRLML
jgi:hypothetical protein